jgi:hypothetical protein
LHQLLYNLQIALQYIILLLSSCPIKETCLSWLSNSPSGLDPAFLILLTFLLPIFQIVLFLCQSQHPCFLFLPNLGWPFGPLLQPLTYWSDALLVHRATAVCTRCSRMCIIAWIVFGVSPNLWLLTSPLWCSANASKVTIFNGKDFSSSCQSLPRLVPWEFCTMVVVVVAVQAFKEPPRVVTRPKWKQEYGHRPPVRINTSLMHPAGESAEARVYLIIVKQH